MMEAIGTMHTYLQQYQLKRSAKQKVKTGQSFDWKDTRSTFVKAQEAAKETKSVFELYAGKTDKNDDQLKSARKSSIKQKLRRGKKLSPEDLEYLRKNDEELYKKAKTTMEEREKLERALKSAKTKAEAQRAVAIAYANAAASLSSDIGGGGGGASAGVSAGGGDVGTAVCTGNGAAALNAETPMGVDSAMGTDASVGTAGAEVLPSVDGVPAEGMSETAVAEAAGTEVNAQTGAEVARENEEATASLRQTGEDVEFDDPLILLVLRHLKAEWNDFMRSKTYRDLPEDEIQEARRHGTEKVRRQRREAEGVKAVSLTAVANAYQTAKLEDEASHVLGMVGAEQ